MEIADVLLHEAQRRDEHGYVHFATVRNLMRRLAHHMQHMAALGVVEPPTAEKDRSDEMRAFVAGWFAHARNPTDTPLFVEDAWHAYRLIESAGGSEA